MQKLTILLNTCDKVRDFVKIAERFEENIDIVRGGYVVDAKSIMGLFSMDLSKKMELIIHSDRKEIADAFSQYAA